MKNLQKGFVVPLLIAIIAVLAIGGGVYYYSKNIKPTGPNTVATTPDVTTVTPIANQSNLFGSTTNGVSDDLLIKIARQYVKNPDKIFYNEKPASLGMILSYKIGFTSDWFATHAPDGIRYYLPNEYKSPYDYLNGKYSVAWTILPGCEKKGDNWVDKNGYNCMGGYTYSVLISDTSQTQELHVNQLKGSVQKTPAEFQVDRLDIGQLD